MGSIDFFPVARSVLLVGRVEGEENISTKSDRLGMSVGTDKD